MWLYFVLQDSGLCHRILFCATGSWSVPKDLFLILQESPPTDYDWLIDSILFGVLLENSSSLIWERHYCRRRRLRNLGPCSVLTAFEAGEIFIVPRLLWQGFLAYRDSSDIVTLSDHWLRQATGPEDLFIPGNPRDATCMCTIERNLQALH